MPATDTQPLNDHRRIDGHSHSGLMAHAHGLTTHTHFHEQDPGWLSFTLRSDAQQDTDQATKRFGANRGGRAAVAV